MRGSGIDSPEARSASVRVLVDTYFLDADATELLAEAGLLAPSGGSPAEACLLGGGSTAGQRTVRSPRPSLGKKSRPQQSGDRRLATTELPVSARSLGRNL